VKRGARNCRSVTGNGVRHRPIIKPLNKPNLARRLASRGLPSESRVPELALIRFETPKGGFGFVKMGGTLPASIGESH
jgi:hypothetical protein